MTNYHQEKNAKEIEKRSNSVKQLCDLYRVIIAIAIGISFHGIVASGIEDRVINYQNILLFLSVLITIIPSFHGAVRHLYATYVEDGGSKNIKNWVILVDYYILLMQGGFFVALASSIGNTENFHIVLIAVLGIDVVWGVLAVMGFAGTQSQKAEMKWAIINFVAVALLITIIFYPPHGSLPIGGLLVMDMLILSVCFLRTIVDYVWNIPFYCPGPKR